MPMVVHVETGTYDQARETSNMAKIKAENLEER